MCDVVARENQIRNRTGFKLEGTEGIKPFLKKHKAVADDLLRQKLAIELKNRLCTSIRFLFSSESEKAIERLLKFATSLALESLDHFEKKIEKCENSYEKIVHFMYDAMIVKYCGQ